MPIWRDAKVTGLILLEAPEGDTEHLFEQVHSPRGSFTVDASWSPSKFPPALRTKSFEEEMQMMLAKTAKRGLPGDAFGNQERPASAANSSPGGRRQGRPLSALAPQRKRPGTAPGGHRQRPTSAADKTYDPRVSKVYVTKSGKELRDEFIASRAKGARLDPKFLMKKFGEDGDLCLISEASTELGADDCGGESDDSDLEDGERLDRAFQRIMHLEVNMEAANIRVEALQSENEQHLAEIGRLEEALGNLEEKNLLLTEAEDRWRDKNTVLRKEQEVDRRNLDRARMNRSDFEDRLRPLDFDMAMTKKIARRRGMVFEKIPFLRQRRTEELGVIWLAWRSETEKAHMDKAFHTTGKTRGDDCFDDSEASQRRVAELELLLEEIPKLEEQLRASEATIQKLRGVQQQAGAKILLNALGLPSDDDITKTAFRQWVDVLPTARLERQLQQFKQAHEELTRRYDELSDMYAALQKEVEGDVRLVKVISQLDLALNRIGTLEADLQMTCQRAASRRSLNSTYEIELEAARERLHVTEKALKAEIVEIDEAWQKRYTDAEEEHAKAMQCVQSDNVELEARVDDLLEALYPEGASGDGRASRPPRVVPRSRGVLCAGCLTQIVYRDVQPVMSARDLQGATQQQLEKERATLFKKTVGGPDPHDPVHAFLWQRRKDPSNVLREVHPESEGDEMQPWSTAVGGIRPRSALQPIQVQGMLGRPQSAGDIRSLPRHRSARAQALRGEVAGFRKVWKG